MMRRIVARLVALLVSAPIGLLLPSAMVASLAAQPASPGDDVDDDAATADADAADVPDPDDAAVDTAPETAAADETAPDSEAGNAGDTGAVGDAGDAGDDGAAAPDLAADSDAAPDNDAGTTDDSTADGAASANDDASGVDASGDVASSAGDDGAGDGGAGATPGTGSGDDDDDDDGSNAGAGSAAAIDTDSDDAAEQTSLADKTGDETTDETTDVASDDRAVAGASPVRADTGEAANAAALRYVGTESQSVRQRLDRAEAIDSDAEGFRYRRGEVLALDVDAAAVARLQRAGFRLVEQHRLAALAVNAVLLATPAKVSDTDALVQLDDLLEGGRHALNHLYDRTAARVRSGGRAERVARRACPCRIGVIDTAVAGNLPDLQRTTLIQQSFNGGTPAPALHGTVISSLIAGTQPAPGVRTEIIVGDVFSGPRQTAGSALAVVRALDWLAAKKIAVINVSLSGANNPVVAAAIQRLTARGHIIVAAAGNDGPAAPPAFPAAYPGVVAVTAVDADRRIYRYANRGSYVAFAARGVDVVGLGPDGKVQAVTGTSFAAPTVAIRLASSVRLPDPLAARTALAKLEKDASDLGAPGRDPVFGAGLIAESQ